MSTGSEGSRPDSASTPNNEGLDGLIERNAESKVVPMEILNRNR